MANKILKAWRLLTLLSVFEIEQSRQTGDLTIKFNGSKLTITADGDINIEAGRNISMTYQYHFANCSPEFIEQVTQQGVPQNLVSLDEYRQRKGAKGYVSRCG